MPQRQLTLQLEGEISTHRTAVRSGTFVDNMRLPIHRWFRYSAGFSAQWVEEVIESWNLTNADVVLDPFAGSATTMIACDTCGVRSIGVEAHSFVARIAQTKCRWDHDLACLRDAASDLVRRAKLQKSLILQDIPPLLKKCYEPDALHELLNLKEALESARTSLPHLDDFIWLAITSILRPCSTAGTAQWQYVLPNKSKARVIPVYEGFLSKIDQIIEDASFYRRHVGKSLSTVHVTDSRQMQGIAGGEISAVITSPPYANNYDYADAARLEMTFWGDVVSWGDLHDHVRRFLVCSNTQHASAEKYELDKLLENPLVAPILPQLKDVCLELESVRETKGGKKHYHTMIARYFIDIAGVLSELCRVCNDRARMCWVIGDSAPYGVYVPVHELIATLAENSGFTLSRFEKIRDRNIKWKNRKHRVPLCEGRLWMER